MSTLLEGILYGFSVLMFIGTMWIFTYKRRTRNTNRPTIAVAALLFILSTSHIAVGIIRVENGLVKYRDTFPGGPVAFFADLTQETFVVKNAILVLQTLLGDGVVIYRCYVVWQSIRVIILPCIMWCGVAAFGVCMVYSMSQPQTDNSTNFFLNAAAQWIMAFLAFTIATNLLSSGLLAYRIWMIERKVSTIHATKNKTPVLRVLVDAAVLYSAAVCSSLISFICSSSGMYVMADLVIPIIPIAFYMVFIRIATSQNNQAYASTVRGGTTETERRSSHYHMQPLHTINLYTQNSGISLADSPKV
ncbi:hypothetical protein DFJ58DRAFT_808062 [Suillus subalutaceus]|uniref:uncharacterized protein n=1 Tax=Suillus subalutaceus TaxID=48586 RepID=UPI001B86E179|nr:uncharacterized protein DFJ58DRAFT_808062 [Suillus subalutaceus]KAG1841536.1 hypothetical protein DFJ58DRAFT_808062 [Suillus subalutaceus]